MNERIGLSVVSAALLATSFATSASASTPSSSAGAKTASTASRASSQPDGLGCWFIPALGKGSVKNMARSRAATAISDSPELSRLSVAIKRAGLESTLNKAPAVTVFAPMNMAFSDAEFKAVLKDKKKLATLLKGHVVAGRIGTAQLDGKHKTLAGTAIKVTGSIGYQNARVNGKNNLTCGAIQTSNATIYWIDSVIKKQSDGFTLREEAADTRRRPKMDLSL